MIAACDDFAAELVAYLDGELGDADRARIETHLGTCLACRQRAGRARTTVDRGGAASARCDGAGGRIARRRARSCVA